MAKPRTSASVKNRYNEKAYDRITVVVPKGSKQILKEYAQNSGISLNAMICDAIREKTGLSLEKVEESADA